MKKKLSQNFLLRLAITWMIVPLLASCAGRAVHEATESKSEAPASRAPADLVAPKAARSAEIEKVTAQQLNVKPEEARRNTEASAEYHFSLAQAYVAEGNPDRAIEEYKLTLMFDPNSPLVYARLATEYIKKGMMSAAMEACKEALQRDPSFVDARLMLAGLYSTAHESASALNEYNRILKSDPKHEEAIVYKSQVLIEEGRAKEAIQDLRKFVKKMPDSVLAYYYLGRAEQHEDHFKEAVQCFKKAAELKPNFAQAALALGYLYEERRMNTEAITAYKEIYDETQDMTAASRLATIYLKEEKYAQAIPYLEAVEAADPDDMSVRVKLGLVQMELKHYDKAIATFRAILEKNPDSDRIHYYLGSLYEESKKTDDAIAQLKQIQTGSKLFVDAALHVAYLYKTSGRVAESKASIRDAISRAPETAGFYIFEASLEEETKNLSGACEILETASRKFPEDEKIRYYLGSLYDRQGEVDKGLEQMEAILKINSENVDALNYIGYTWTIKGVRLNDAEKLLRRALVLRPNNGYIQDSWGWYLFTRGRLGEAVVELEKAARLKPNEATILEHLGDAYMRSNLREKAMLQYNDAAKFADDDEAKRKLEMKIKSLRDGSVEVQVRMPASQPTSVGSQSQTN